MDAAAVDDLARWPTKEIGLLDPSQVATDDLVDLTTNSGCDYGSALPKQAVGSLEYRPTGCWESEQAETTSSFTVGLYCQNFTQAKKSYPVFNV